MLEFRTYTCIKCGKTFKKGVGGVVMTPKQMELEARLVCGLCKLKQINDILDF